MIIVKVVSPEEIDLTNDEIRELCEFCGGNADDCYFKFHFSESNEYGYEENVLNILQQKMKKSGLFVDKDDVFIDLTW